MAGGEVGGKNKRVVFFFFEKRKKKLEKKKKGQVGNLFEVEGWEKEKRNAAAANGLSVAARALSFARQRGKKRSSFLLKSVLKNPLISHSLSLSLFRVAQRFPFSTFSLVYLAPPRARIW